MYDCKVYYKSFLFNIYNVHCEYDFLIFLWKFNFNIMNWYIYAGAAPCSIKFYQVFYFLSSFVRWIYQCLIASIRGMTQSMLSVALTGNSNHAGQALWRSQTKESSSTVNYYSGSYRHCRGLGFCDMYGPQVFLVCVHLCLLCMHHLDLRFCVLRGPP